MFMIIDLSNLNFKFFQYIGVRIKAGQQMFWYNDESPSALGNITGTGNFGIDENKHYSSIIYDFVEKQLGIPQDRYIQFNLNQLTTHLYK